MARFGRGQPFSWKGRRIIRAVTGYVLAATAGTYAQTGTAAALQYGHKLACASGTYAQTGTAATLKEADTVIAVTDANFYCSPFNTYSNGGGALGATNVKGSSTYIQWNTPGAEIKTNFSGTSVKLKVDLSMRSGQAATDYPVIAYSVDGAALTRYQFLSTDTTVTLATGLTDTTHTLRIVYAAGTASDELELWIPTLINVLKVTGLAVDHGKVLSAPTRNTNTLLVYGDSITAGFEAVAPGTPLYYATEGAAEQSYGMLVAAGLSCEVGLVGYAATGYATAAGNVPSFINNYNLYFQSQSRLVSGLFSPQPTFILVDHGINGTTTSGNVQTILGSLRTAAPSARIFVVVPCNGAAATPIAAGVTAFGDANVQLINTGVTSYATTDGLHLSAAGHAAYAADILAEIVINYVLPATGGTYAQTGTAATLKIGRKVGAASGTYALTGTAATLSFGHKIVATGSSYAQTGTAATLSVGHKFAAASGSYSYTGTAAALRFGHTIGAAAGSYAYTGTAATLRIGRKVNATPGVYAQTGTAASLRATRTLVIGSSSYSYTGTAAALRVDRRIVAVGGSYSYTGTPATLTYSNAGASTYTLVAAGSSYAQTGTTAVLRYARHFPIDSGVYAQSGTTAALRAARQLVCLTGSYIYTGATTGLRAARTLALASGSYTYTGTSAGLKRGPRLIVVSGSYTYTGTAAVLKLAHKLTVVPGTYSYTGTTALLTFSGVIGPSTFVTRSSGLDVFVTCPASGLDVYHVGLPSGLDDVL